MFFGFKKKRKKRTGTFVMHFRSGLE